MQAETYNYMKGMSIMKRKLFSATIALLITVTFLATMLSGCDFFLSDPVEEYIALESKAMHQLIDEAFASASASDDIHTTTTVDVMPSDALFELMSRQDLNWIDKISLSLNVHQKGNLTETIANVGMNSNPFFSFNTIFNPMTGITYWAIPTISDYFMESTDSTANGIASMNQVLSQLNTPETEVAKNLLIKYVDVFLNNMVNIERTKETITVQTVSQEATVYTNYITERVFLDAIVAVLTEAKNDSQFKAIFPAEANIDAALDEAIASLKSSEVTDDKNDAIILVTYADKDNNVLGRKFTISNLTFSHISLGSVSETFLGNEETNYRLVGTRSARQSDYTLLITSAGQSIEIGKITLTGNEKEGACDITLSNFIEQNLFGTPDADVSLNIKWKITDTSTAVDFSLYMVSQQIIAVKTTTTACAPEDVTLPSISLDTMDPSQSQTFFDSINTYELMNNMLAIGFPSEYIDAVINYLEGIDTEIPVAPNVPDVPEEPTDPVDFTEPPTLP